MSDKLTFGELLESEIEKYPSLLIWNSLTKIIALVPAVLYLIILAVIMIESPDSVGMYTLRGFLYFACYGGFLKTFFELDKLDAFVVVFGIGTVAFFVNNLFYTGVSSIIGVLIDLVIVWIAVSVYNYKKARNDAQLKAFEMNRYSINKANEKAENEALAQKAEISKAATSKAPAVSEQKKSAAEAVKELETQATFSKAFEEFQKSKS